MEITLQHSSSLTLAFSLETTLLFVPFFRWILVIKLAWVLQVFYPQLFPFIFIFTSQVMKLKLKELSEALLRQQFISGAQFELKLPETFMLLGVGEEEKLEEEGQESLLVLF